MNIFLHIGKPRTATTSLQSGLRVAQNDLADAGLCFPNAARSGDRHMQLVWAAAHDQLAPFHRWHRDSYDQRSIKQHVEDIVAEADGRDIVLSSEWFSTAVSDKTYWPVVEALAKFGNVVTLVTLRAQEEVFVSSYLKRLLDRTYRRPLKNFTGSDADWGKKPAPLNHYKLLQDWTAVSDVRVFEYGPKINERILNNIGYGDIARFTRENSSIPLELSEYVRSHSVLPIPKSEFQSLTNRIAANPDEFSEHSRSEIVAVAEEIKQRVRLAYAPSNKRVKEEFGQLFVCR